MARSSIVGKESRAMYSKTVGFQADDEGVKRRCHRCQGDGRAPCQVCYGKGYVMKGRDKLGKPVEDRCSGCFGNKTCKCAICNGTGFA